MSASGLADYQGNDSVPFTKEEFDAGVEYLGEKGELTWRITLKNNVWFRMKATMARLAQLDKELAEARFQRDAAQAACVAKDAALRLAETDLGLCMTELSAETAHSLEAVRAALATNAGAPVLALLDECAAALESLAEQQAMPDDWWRDLHTRLKARGPSRFVSVEKVREVAMETKAACVASVAALPEDAPMADADYAVSGVDIDALLAEVTT